MLYRMHAPHRSAVDPTGALYRSGRWHTAGTQVLYTAEHISLAALEILVHSDGRQIPPKAITTLHIPGAVSFEESGWMDKPNSQAYGDEWARAKRSLLLKVPIIAADKMESNYLINPALKQFKLISLASTRPFAFDPRFIHLP